MRKQKVCFAASPLKERKLQMSKNVKQQILDELNSRIGRLKQHADDPIVQADNNYDVLNQALSKTIGEPLCKELESVRDFVETL